MADIFVAATGNDTTGDGSVGNPYATLGKAGSVRAAGDVVYLKYSASPYVLTSASSNVAGGTFTISTGAETTLSWLVGYDTNATITNTDANRPTVQIPSSGITTVTVVNCSATYSGVRVRNIIVDGAGKTAITGFAGTTSGAHFENCTALNCTTGFTRARAYNCMADTCGTGFSDGSAHGCVSKAHTSRGFFYGTSKTSGWATCCIAYGGTGASTDGFFTGANDSENSFVNCVAYGNGRHGFNFVANFRGPLVTNCVAVGNAAYGFITAASTTATMFRNNAGYNNTSGNTSFTYADQSSGFTALSGDPFTNAAGGDFSLNNTAGAGASCRAAGFPGVFPGGLTTGYLDLGAAQHADPGGGGSASMSRPVSLSGGLV